MAHPESLGTIARGQADERQDSVQHRARIVSQIGSPLDVDLLAWETSRVCLQYPPVLPLRQIGVGLGRLQPAHP